MIYNAADNAEFVIDNFGTEVKIYNPKVTFNDEGDRTINLGIPLVTKAFMSDITEEDITSKIEGVDLSETIRLFFKSNDAVSKSSIVEIDGPDDRYKVISLDKAPIAGEKIYRSIVVTKTKFKEA